VTPVQGSLHEPDKDFEFDGRNMKAVAVLSDFLNYKLDLAEQVCSTALQNSKSEQINAFKYLRCSINFNLLMIVTCCPS
jgi:hypothetical protein